MEFIGWNEQDIAWGKCERLLGIVHDLFGVVIGRLIFGKFQKILRGPRVKSFGPWPHVKKEPFFSNIFFMDSKRGEPIVSHKKQKGQSPQRHTGESQKGLRALARFFR